MTAHAQLDGLSDDERWLLRPATARFVSPMLATLTDRYFSADGWIYERKLDGVRTVVVRSDGGTALYSRNHKPTSGTYPELVRALNSGAPLRTGSRR
ncbi:MAG TPA: hypothetical protein VFE65_17805 [Pseudonocardia sp.]|nr:hypothetical protein [Pseudonocardia sp.]